MLCIQSHDMALVMLMFQRILGLVTEEIAVPLQTKSWGQNFRLQSFKFVQAQAISCRTFKDKRTNNLAPN